MNTCKSPGTADARTLAVTLIASEATMRATHLLPVMLALVTCGCVDSRPTAATPTTAASAAAATAAAAAAAIPTVVAISVADGVTRIEGTAPTALPAGTLLRLYEPAPGGRMKGMAVVAAWADGHFTARLTGLTDKNRPITTGDRAVPGDVDLPPAAAAQPEVVRAAALERQLAERNAETARNDRAFADLHALATKLPPPTAAGTGLGDELARIEAERAYFDLCARVLSLNIADPAVIAVQDQIRHSLASRADLADPASGALKAAKPEGEHHGH